jgi:photosystem II stability/assembly factor-like uncharacterized protein
VQVADVPVWASFEVLCPSVSNCYLAADPWSAGHDRLWRSDDGGGSWSAVALPVGYGAIGDIDCPAALSCRMIDAYERVFSTDDGGASWTDWHAPVFVSPGDPVTLSCPTTADCVILLDDASAVATHDGGSSWVAESPPGYVLDLVCPTALRCVGLTSDGLSSMLGVVGWDIGGAGSSPFAFPVSVADIALSCAGLHCVALGPTTDRLSMLAVHTDDGGVTWREAARHTSASIGGVSCVDAMRCMAAVTTESVDWEVAGSVRVTSDGGATWGSRTGPIGWNRVDAVECMRTGRCVVLRNARFSDFRPEARVAWSDDFGSTWHETDPPAGESFRLNPTVSCSVDGRCFLSSDDALFLSNDAGATWSLVFGGEFGVSYAPGTCDGAGVCMTVRRLPSSSELLVSRDGGQSWAMRALPLAGASSATVRCSQPSRCFLEAATPSQQALFGSTDGGDSWSSVRDALGPLRGGWVDCSEALRCIAVTRDGDVAASATGGERWARLAVATPVQSEVVARIGTCPSADLCFSSSDDTIERVELGLPSAGGFDGLLPARLLDSRPTYSTVDGVSAGVGVRAGGSVTELVVAGRGGVSVGAESVVLNVTVTEAQGSGFVTVWPCGEGRPNASSVNYVSGQTVANAVTSRVGAGGKVCLFTSATIHLVVDAGGSFR